MTLKVLVGQPVNLFATYHVTIINNYERLKRCIVEIVLSCFKQFGYKCDIKMAVVNKIICSNYDESHVYVGVIVLRSLIIHTELC